MRWTSLAASLILGAALVSTWLSLTPATPGSSVSSASPIAQAQATDGAVPQSSISSLMWGGTYEDSTTALLDMVEPLAQEMPSTPPEAITNYLSPAESGGWNG
jgi:hypothetical protein